MKSKKGQGWAVDSMPFYVIFVMVVGVLVLIFSLLMQRYIADQFMIPEGLEDDLLSQRFFGVHCFGAESVFTGRQHDVIDFSRFTQERLDDCYVVDKNFKYFAYKIHLLLGEESTIVQTANWRESSAQRRRVKEVEVLKENILLRGNIIIEVQHE